MIRTLRVPAGFDVADNEIVRLCSAEDLVITADIPLAAEVLAKGAAALNPRGERYTEATIREKLTLRDFMDTLRASGIQTGGPDSLSQRDRQQFAAQLDKWLLEVKRRRGQNKFCATSRNRVWFAALRACQPVIHSVMLPLHVLPRNLYSLTRYPLWVK